MTTDSTLPTVDAGFALIDNREFLQAEGLFEALLGRDAGDVCAAHGMILAKRRQGYFAEVIERCDALLERHPEDPLALGERIVALVRAGQVERALTQRENLGRTHNREEATMWLASAMLTAGRAKEAQALAQSELGGEWGAQLFSLQIMVAISETEAWDGLDGCLAKSPPLDKDPIWARYEFMRCHRIDDASMFDAEVGRSLSIEVGHYCPRGSGMAEVVDGAAPSGFITPSVTRERLRAGVAGFLECLRRLSARGEFDNFRASVRNMRRRFAAKPQQPVQVLSTGRCGTMALHQLLLRSQRTISYHTCHWQLLSVDRNHILYRILENRFNDDDAVATIVCRYLQMRVSEFAYAARCDAGPVIINHWDTIMAPVNAIVYDDIRFLHMHRAEAKVFESIFTKNQWQNEQLRHCLYDPGFPGGRFVCSHSDRRSVEEQIAWYLHVTFELGKTMADLLPAGRVEEVPSEHLFDRKPAAISALREMMTIEDLGDADFEAVFATKINEKTNRRQTVSEMAFGEALGSFQAALAALRKDGRLA